AASVSCGQIVTLEQFLRRTVAALPATIARRPDVVAVVDDSVRGVSLSRVVSAKTTKRSLIGSPTRPPRHAPRRRRPRPPRRRRARLAPPSDPAASTKRTDTPARTA